MASILRTDQIDSSPGRKTDFYGVPNGFVVGTGIIQNSVRTSMTNSVSEYIAFSGTYTKIRSDTYILATCTVFGSAFSSGNLGVGMRLNGIWDHGSAYQYDGLWTRDIQTTVVMGTAYWNIPIPAGNCTIGWGWRPINGATSERVFDFLNPASTPADARVQQMTSSILVYEITQ